MHREAFGHGLGRRCYKVYKHRTEECTPCVVRETFDDGEVHLHEEVVTDQHGRRINVMVYTGPLFDADGNIEFVIEMSADITQIRQLQSQLTSIGMLISTISHGIKGLMTGLDGGAYLLNTGLKKGDQTRVTKGWDMVQRNMGRIRSMVFDLLYYAKDRELEVETVSATVIAEEAARQFTDKAQKLDITFKCDFHPDTDSFNVDPKAIHTMLTNLLENAMDACRTDQDKPTHEVGFNVYPEDKHVVFQISDNGVGMDQETKEKVFSLFFSSKGTEGTGLGLFIANKIAMKHGGKIKIESAPGTGTCFWVQI
ncbi:nitrogen regulation protein NR(II), partial [Candidatus Zixiibacteriota bacterium]